MALGIASFVIGQSIGPGMQIKNCPTKGTKGTKAPCMLLGTIHTDR
ncbi:unnamed protein product [Anisakis simplex]|uniref:Thyroglobulin type-1 domain-containing protein n=1 Tax=Anisakis simplex TaxID=6269 RepID=A0A0M3JMC2_ANISI|nr:unnamed protein product [Anisakis simplex]